MNKIVILFILPSKQTLIKLIYCMIAPLSRMAGAMSPAMYRYIRSYIRFLLPRRDQALEVLIRQLRFAPPNRLPHLERRLNNRYKPHRLKYYFERLWCLIEEVLLDPLQPWNDAIHGNSDVAMQRKLLGGLRLASSGLVEPGHLRIQEVMRAVQNEQNPSLGLKLQASLYSTPESDAENSKVSEKMGNLVDEYLSVVKSRQVLNELIKDQVLKGTPPIESLIFTGNEVFPELKLAAAINTIIGQAMQADAEAVNASWSQVQKIIQSFISGIPNLEPMIQARIGLSFLGHPGKFKLAMPWLLQAFKSLPTENPLYSEVFRYRVQLLALEGKLAEVEKILHNSERHPNDDLSKNLNLPMLHAMVALMKEETGKTLQQIVKIPLIQYTEPSVRIVEVFQYLDQGLYQTSDCRLEALRKLLARRGEKESRARSIQKILARLNVLCSDFRTFQRLHLDMMLELSEVYPWTPINGEWFPLEVWFRARLNQKPMAKIAHSWLQSLE